MADESLYSIVRKPEPTPEDIYRIAAPLHRFNEQHGPPLRYLPVALALEDASGVIVGGLWGKCYFDWLFVEYLAVPEDARGQGLGTALLAAAETIARNHACAGIWLDTFSFQALPFYEKLGFIRFGQIDGYPIGGSRFFLQKRL